MVGTFVAGGGVMRLARLVATWFGCGLIPVAPGTFGTLGALPLYILVRGGGPLTVLMTAACVAAVGIWVADIVSRETRQRDPSIVVIDEVAGALIAFAAAGSSRTLMAVAFFAFRVFDIVKIFPARDAERLPGGWGIVVDDLVAGAWAALLVLAVRATTG